MKENKRKSLGRKETVQLFAMWGESTEFNLRHLFLPDIFSPTRVEGGN